MRQSRPTKRRLRLAAAASATAAALALSGCDGGQTTPDNNELTLPSNGGSAVVTEVGQVEENLTSASFCSLDGAEQWSGANEDNTRRYRRTAGDVTEEYMIGAFERDRSAALLALDELEEHVTSARCRQGSSGGDTWATTSIDGLGRHTVAFRSVWTMGGTGEESASDADAANAGRHSFLRAYRYTGGHMVLAWIEHHGKTNPDVDRLETLLDKASRGVGG